jgi:hypothetical protein
MRGRRCRSNSSEGHSRGRAPTDFAKLRADASPKMLLTPAPTRVCSAKWTSAATDALERCDVPKDRDLPSRANVMSLDALTTDRGSLSRLYWLEFEPYSEVVPTNARLERRRIRVRRGRNLARAVAVAAMVCAHDGRDHRQHAHTSFPATRPLHGGIAPHTLSSAISVEAALASEQIGLLPASAMAVSCHCHSSFPF